MRRARTALARMRAILELDVREVLPLVTAPTLVIQNRADGYVRAGHGRYLADHIPRRPLLERDSADHWPSPIRTCWRDRGVRHRFAGPGGRRRSLPDDRALRRRCRLDRARQRARRPALEHAPGVVRGDVERALLAYRGDSSTGRATGSSRPSTGRHARSAAHTTFATRFDRAGSTSAAASTRARSTGGTDVAGIAVHIGARVSAAAAPARCW